MELPPESFARDFVEGGHRGGKVDGVLPVSAGRLFKAFKLYAPALYDRTLKLAALILFKI